MSKRKPSMDIDDAMNDISGLTIQMMKLKTI